MTFTSIMSDVSGVRDTPAISAQKGIAALARRQDNDVAVEADGDLTLLLTNEEGRLKVTTKPGAFPNSTQNITANGQSLAVDVSRASNITVHIKGGGIAGVGGNFSFEASLDSTNGTDGTWFGIQAARTNANTIESATGALALSINTGNAYAWELSVNAYNWVRVRTTAWTSGVYVITIVRGSYATEPIPAVQAHAVTLASTAITAVSPGSAATNLGKLEDGVHTSGDTGVAVWAVRNDNAAADLTSATGDYSPFATDIRGALFTREKPAPTPALTSVAASATSVAILAANAARRKAIIVNDGTGVLYLKFGATASLTSFTAPVAAGGYYEVPDIYTGQIDGIWTSPNGSARITELT